MKLRFEDQENTGTTPKDEAGIKDAGGGAAAQAPRGSCCSPRRRGSSCSPAGGEEPAAASAVAESALSPARKAGDGVVRRLKADAN